jgi:hypothetical protein
MNERQARWRRQRQGNKHERLAAGHFGSDRYSARP